MHICHISTVHPRTDTRIFLKYCKTSGSNYGQCSFIVADGKGSLRDGNVDIIDLGKSRTPLRRIFSGFFKVIKNALKIRANVFHIHDPELIFAGIFLRMLKKIVVMDIHEDAPAQLKDKHYLNSALKSTLSVSLKLTEIATFRFFSGLIAATPHLKGIYSAYNRNVIGIYNYLLISELQTDDIPRDQSPTRRICFVGGIEEKRGIRQLIEALPLVRPRVELILGGNFPDQSFYQSLTETEGWGFVDFRGYLTRDQMTEVFQESSIGVVTFLPAENHNNSLPNKIFEYMGAGLPVLASNFDSWANLIEGKGLGCCVDPTDQKLIAGKIESMLSDGENLKHIGRVGTKMVKETYNWDSQLQSLFEFYSSLARL